MTAASQERVGGAAKEPTIGEIKMRQYGVPSAAPAGGSATEWKSSVKGYMRSEDKDKKGNTTGRPAATQSPYDAATSEVGSFRDDKAERYFDETGKNVDAYTRVTRTPITFIRNSYQGEPAEGEYRRELDDKRDHGHIDINLSPGASWSDMSNVITHEQIHAFMDHLTTFGVGSYPEGQQTFLQSILGKYDPSKKAFPSEGTHKMDPFNDVFASAIEAWKNSQRGGDRGSEIPAYMMAFKEGQLAGVTQENSEEYTRRFVEQLIPAERDKLLSILASYKASKNPPSRLY